MSSQMPGGTSWSPARVRRVGAKWKRNPPVVFRRRPVPRSVTRALVGSRVHTFKRQAASMILRCTPGSGNAIDFIGSGLTGSASVVDPDFSGTQMGGASMNFQLNFVTNPTEFTTLFDRYRIVGVKLQFLPGQNNSDAYINGFASPLPYLYYAQDWDDAGVPGSQTEVTQYGTVKCRRLDKPFSVFIKPKAAAQVYHTGVTSAFATANNAWIDCSNGDVQHYGMKLWLKNVMCDPSHANFNCVVIPTYYLQFRDSR